MSIVLKQWFLCCVLILPALPVWAVKLELEAGGHIPRIITLGTWYGQSSPENSYNACIIASDNGVPTHYDLSVMDIRGENLALRTGDKVVPVTFTIKGT
ncbi:hypothetical protein, partial [Sansalvadorimonas verongulae]|uniref:hypothetical protein n=1 Tax=Sansalvadorimonas verongulae TaxID=2172824 RepID=UPI001E2E6F85